MLMKRKKFSQKIFFTLILLICASCSSAETIQSPTSIPTETAIPPTLTSTNTPEPTETPVPTSTPTLVPSLTPTDIQQPKRDKPMIGVDVEDLEGLMYILQLFVNDGLGSTRGPEMLPMTWEADEAYCGSDIIKPFYLFDDNGENTGKCIKISNMCFDEGEVAWESYYSINPLPCNATMAIVDNRVPYPKGINGANRVPSGLHLFGVENDLWRYNTEEIGVYFYLYYLANQTVEELEEVQWLYKEGFGEGFWSSNKFHFLIKASSDYGTNGRHAQLTIYAIRVVY